VRSRTWQSALKRELAGLFQSGAGVLGRIGYVALALRFDLCWMTMIIAVPMVEDKFGVLIAI